MIRVLLKIVGIIVLAIVAIPVGCLGSAGVYEAWHTYTYRYRLTLDVETPTGVKSSASVIEVSIRKKATWVAQTGGVLRRVRGEAVFVDLGGGGNVIALLASGPEANDVNYPSYIVSIHAGLGNEIEDLVKYPSLQGSWDLPRLNLPTLMTFLDLHDPETALVVRPEEFGRVFGPGIRFRRTSIEIVPSGMWPFRALGWPLSLAGEPVTREIEKKIPEIIRQLREQSRMLQVRKVGDPYDARLGHFFIGD